MRKRLSEWNRLIHAALRSVDPHNLIPRWVRLEKDGLRIGSERYDLKGDRAVYVIGAGKASAAMASALEEILGERITAGVVVTRYGYRAKTRRIRVHDAGHPIPDRAGVTGSRTLLKLLERCRPEDLTIALWSGGASALLPLPADGITLRDKQRVTDQLLRSGAAIGELNTVRKHLSQLKGGQLAARCRSAHLISLILSDVIGNPLDAIGSGPTAPDPTTFADAITILKRYRIWAEAPHSVRRHLQAGSRGLRPETPKPGDSVFERVHNVIIGDSRTTVEAVAESARALGLNAFILTAKLQGEAREAAKLFGTLAREVRKTGKPVPRPACLVAGGELTVTVTGRGRGGRCQELALAAAKEIAGLSGTTLAAFGTDGMDGTTDAAGAVVDDSTLLRAARRGLDPDRFLARNDSYHFFKKLGGLIQTGPTGTNVNDIYLLLVR